MRSLSHSNSTRGGLTLRRRPLRNSASWTRSRSRSPVPSCEPCQKQRAEPRREAAENERRNSVGARRKEGGRCGVQRCSLANDLVQRAQEQRGGSAKGNRETPAAVVSDTRSNERRACRGAPILLPGIKAIVARHTGAWNGADVGWPRRLRRQLRRPRGGALSFRDGDAPVQQLAHRYEVASSEQERLGRARRCVRQKIDGTARTRARTQHEAVPG